MDKPLPTTQTTMVNEVTIVSLPAGGTIQSPDGQLRSDRLPPLPDNTFFGVMKMLDKPEPIRKPNE
jgi:hypothetical protein